MNTNSKQSTGRTHSGAVCRGIVVLFGLFAFIWLPTPEVDAALHLESPESPPDCELDDPHTCPQTNKVTVFRWTRSENPGVSYRVDFSDFRDFSEIILNLPESDKEKIIARQVALDLRKPVDDQGNSIFQPDTNYFWRVVALDGFGGEVEESPETFAFYYVEDNSGFTVISGLVSSDLRQAALVGARVSVASKGHRDTFKHNNSVVVSSDREYYVIVRTSKFDDTPIPISAETPLQIMATKKGFKSTHKFLDDPEKLTGVELPMSSEFDGDGILDVVENDSPCLDDEDADTDDDGIADGDEDTNKNGAKNSGETDPCRLDTDSDGIQDGTELGLILDDIGSDTDTAIFQPDLDPSTKTDPLDDDSDDDGLSDGEEDKNHNGRLDAGETEPGSPNVRAFPHILLLLIGD